MTAVIAHLSASIGGSFLLLAVGGLAGYFLLCGASHAYFWVARKERHFPDETLDPAQLRRERAWSVVSILGNAVLTAPITWLVAHGRSRLYPGFGDRGLGWALVSIALYLVVTDTLIYWIHRALHVPFLYARLHKVHHSFRTTSPWASFAFHPLDAFAQAVPHHLCAFLFPAPAAVYWGFLIFVSIWTVAIHDRVSIVRWSVLNYTGHHTVHHRFNKHHYGQFLTAWDRLCGTYRHPAGLVVDGGDRRPS